MMFSESDDVFDCCSDDINEFFGVYQESARGSFLRSLWSSEEFAEAARISEQSQENDSDVLWCVRGVTVSDFSEEARLFVR